MSKERFLTGGALGYKLENRNTFSRRRGPNPVEELFEAIVSKFRLNCTSYLSFEEIFEHLRTCSNGLPWRYIKGDRSVLRAIIQNYEENFEFSYDNFTRVHLINDQKFVTKNDCGETLKQKCENEEVTKKWNEIYKSYNLVYEYDALNLIYAIFHHSDCDKLHFDLIEQVLKRKIRSSNDYAELINYLGPSVKQYMKDRFHLFVEQGDYFMLRPNFYADIVYYLNEYIRDTSQGTNKKPLEALIKYYLSSEEITLKIRTEMNIQNRDDFIMFLQNNRFVFDIRLLKDFEILSNLCIPRLDWKKVGRNKNLICKDFDKIFQHYEDENKGNNLLQTASYDNDDDYFQSKFNPENAVYEEQGNDYVQLTHDDVVTNGTVTNTFENGVQSNLYLKTAILNPFMNRVSNKCIADKTDESNKIWQMRNLYKSISKTAQNINSPLNFSSSLIEDSWKKCPSSKVELNQVRKHFLSNSICDDNAYGVNLLPPMIYKNQQCMVQQFCPQSTKPPLPSVCPSLLSPVGQAATVRRQGKGKKVQTWEDIEKDWDAIYNGD